MFGPHLPSRSLVAPRSGRLEQVRKANSPKTTREHQRPRNILDSNNILQLHDLAPSPCLELITSQQHDESISWEPRHEKDLASTVSIELFPGALARLRGAKETLECISQDRYSPVTCSACSLHLFCIEDAEFVLCPACQVVGPLGTGGDGVGLGFTIEDLQGCQNDILRSRRRL